MTTIAQGPLMRLKAMRLPRRRFLQHAASAAALLARPRVAAALDYPTRPVRMLVGFAPGSAPDVSGRLIGQWLSDRLARPFVVENKPGGSGNLATEAAIHAAADGHTLLLVATGYAINATLYENLNYNFARDLAPVAGLSREPNLMVVNPAFPATTVPDFINYARANPGKINMASPGLGTSPHMAGELFKSMAGVGMTHVAYRGSPAAITDLLGGQVQVYFAPISTSIEYVRAGKLRALAVTTAMRAPALPDIPPLNDFVPGYEMSGWYGIVAPKKTPAAIIDRLNKEVNAGLGDPSITARLAALGSSTFIVSPADFGKFIADEIEKWAKVVKSERIKPD
ncbi:MAG TPA: tripartite tricarboxylate transporter substrate binding protein [Xanthobacteraceae bacterium]